MAIGINPVGLWNGTGPGSKLRAGILFIIQFPLGGLADWHFLISPKAEVKKG